MAEVAAPWACPACTYRHEGAEAGFLQCAMCGGSKPTTETAPAPAPRPSPPKKRPSPSPKKPAKRRRSSVSPQKGPTIADYFRRPPKARRTPRSAAPRWRRGAGRRGVAAQRARRRRPPRVERRRRAAAAAAPAPAVSRRRRRARGFVERGVQRAPRRRRGAAGGSRGRPHRCHRRRPDAVAEARERRRRAVGVAAAGRRRRAAAPASPTVERLVRRRRRPRRLRPASVDDALRLRPGATAGRRPRRTVARASSRDAVSATRSRLAKENALTNALRWGLAAPTTSAQDLAALCYLLAPTRDSQGGGHRLEPDWQHVALGLPSKAIADGCAAGAGASPDALKAAARRTGGLADAVVALRAGPPSFFKAKAPEAAVARSRAAADVRASLRALGRALDSEVDGIAKVDVWHQAALVLLDDPQVR